MSTFTAPRSPLVTRLIERTKELAPLLPANDDAEAALFPPAYIESGPELDRALASLNLERPRLHRGAPKLTFGLAVVWLTSALAISGALVVAMAAALTVLAQLQAFVGGR